MNLSIIGTGYVGLVTGACLADIGHRVVCVDRIAERCEQIGRGQAPFYEPGLDRLVSKSILAGTLSATTDLRAAVESTDLTLIAVGTPDQDGRIDLSQLEAAARDIAEVLKTKASYHVVAVKSTVVPGTTDGVVGRTLEHVSGKRIGPDIGLVMNPEFLREGTAIEDFMVPDRIVIGAVDQRSAEMVASLYEKFDCPKPIMSSRSAEFTKYASNALFATLISFSNELAGLCEATTGCDLEIVMDGLHLDKRLSPVLRGERIRPQILSYLRPSSGYGGSCFPKDVAALRCFAHEKSVDVPLLDAVVRVNEDRPKAVLDLAERRFGTFSGRTVCVLGLAFKSGTDDLRNSPALMLVKELLARGAVVSVYDPVATNQARPIFGQAVSYGVDAYDALQGCEMVVIGTGWPEWHDLDWKKAGDLMRRRLVFDARNSLRALQLPEGFLRLQIGVAP